MASTPSSNTGPDAFRRAVEVLCLSREDIASELGLAPDALERYLQGPAPPPAATALGLVGLLKVREVALESAASVLYEEAMLRATGDSATGDSPASSDRATPAPSGRPD